jgi:mannose-6-phosphate isomerase-like protein (cupin superfamily)
MGDSPQVRPLEKRWELIDFDRLEGVACPCGTARRALVEAADLPFTLHRTEIADDARVHYHRRLTETYFVLECAPGAALLLDGETVPLRPGVAVVIRPGVRHRALGQMTVLIFVWPKFDPADEWFD